ncbi:MAG TPA: PadR family transcriptional regulator [Gemmatimonadaceae bacterium]|nr:PadR family transcriptional regulator [Gemmatimonadaceae bacterium]
MPGSDIITGTLDILILKAVSWGPEHGYGIGKWIRQNTGDNVIVQEGVLYPALHRLERKGLLLEKWGQSDGGRAAKFYTLSAAGRKHLVAEAKRWTNVARSVTYALGRT